MEAPALLAIDEGTTGTRAILFSASGDIPAAQSRELSLYYPHNGWVEQNPEDIWNATLACCRDVLMKMSGQTRIAAIGITNQRETTILWDRATGQAVYNAIVWQDRRTADACERLKEAGHENAIRSKTGLLLDPYFSATKIAWILDNVPDARKRAEAGDLCFGTVDSFLLWRLTGGKIHATDATNAARTLLFNILTQDWDDDLLSLFNIPKSLLPEVKDNCTDFGVVERGLLPGGDGLTIGGMAGDQQAAVIGQACFSEGMVKSTYGTGCFALMHIGETFQESQNRLLTTPAYRLNGKTAYAMEGAIFTAGAAIQWLRDGLGILKNAADSEKMAESVLDNGGVYFIPAFTGLGAPHWNPHARAAISGLTRDSTAAHIVRAALEAQAYQTLDLMDAFAADTGREVDVLRADGGLVANAFMCRFLADMLDCPVEVPAVVDTTALGAAYLAGLQAGIYGGLEDISSRWCSAKRYEPSISSVRREDLYAGWKAALQRVLE